MSDAGRIGERVVVDRTLDSARLSAVRQALAKLSEAVGLRYSVSLDVIVDVVDPDRPHALPLLTTGLSTSGGKPPHRTWGDSTSQKYVTGGRSRSSPTTTAPDVTACGTSSSRIRPARDVARPWLEA
jgi:hypothetical protein